ncbi:hypothetical protein ScPMuIL_002419 [Solemya velum]
MIKITGRNILVLNNHELIKECFDTGPNASLMNGRAPSFLGKYAVNGYKDILLRRNDSTFKKLKGLSWGLMKKHCDQSSLYEECMREEMDCVVEKFRETTGENVDPMEILLPSIGVLTAMLFTGERIGYSDKGLRSLMDFDECGDELVQFKNQSALNMFPWLRHLPGKLGRLFQNLMDCRSKIFQKFIVEMKETYSPKKGRCFMHGMFDAQQPGESGSGWLTDDHIHGVVLDLINTSAHTSKGMVSGFLLLLVNSPEVCRRIQEEIDRVIGHARKPTLEDMASMPYTHACIIELFRIQTHVPISAPHYNHGSEVEINGYTIPKNTIIFGNYWASNHDERLWNDPWEFQPQRFLDETGQLKKDDPKRKQILSFGVGERYCAGHVTAVNRLFMYTTTLLKNFDILPPEGAELPSAHPTSLIPGKVLVAPKFQCRFVQRSIDTTNGGSA